MVNKLLQEWFKLKAHPLLIAGPCSAEDEEQLERATSELINLVKPHVIRAGVWKPRTRPNSFEGKGEVALKWLQAIKEKYGIPVATEVATPAHAELAMKYDIDVLWLGARTTTSPFSVQEISEVIKDKPKQIVLVKNPINAEFPLWIGGIERLFNSGLDNVGAIHRGFSGSENGVYRNLPMWNQPMELRRIFPNLPIICDPSHICGQKESIERVCQMAVDLTMDGLMIESHPTPDLALSDAKQQVTPVQLKKILDSLVIKIEKADDPKFESKIEFMRSKIDRFDDEILEFMKLRLDICFEIGQEKAKQKVTVLQTDRMDWLLKQWHEKGSKLGLNEDFINKLFHLIHEESVRIQSEIPTPKK